MRALCKMFICPDIISVYIHSPPELLEACTVQILPISKGLIARVLLYATLKKGWYIMSHLRWRVKHGRLEIYST